MPARSNHGLPARQGGFAAALQALRVEHLGQGRSRGGRRVYRARARSADPRRKKQHDERSMAPPGRCGRPIGSMREDGLVSRPNTKGAASQIGYEARFWQTTHALRRSIETAESEPIDLGDAPASSNPSSEATVVEADAIPAPTASSTCCARSSPQDASATLSRRLSLFAFSELRHELAALERCRLCTAPGRCRSRHPGLGGRPRRAQPPASPLAGACGSPDGSKARPRCGEPRRGSAGRVRLAR